LKESVNLRLKGHWWEINGMWGLSHKE